MQPFNPVILSEKQKIIHMSKTLLLSGISGLIAICTFGQAQLGRIEYQKKDRQAVVLYTQYSTEIVEGAIKERMDQLGNKGRENKSFINLGKGNFIAYKGASVPNIKGTYDLYFKVERKSRREKEESVVYLVIGKGPDDFASSTTDCPLMDEAKSFMNSLPPHIEAYNLEVDIKGQEDMLAKIQGKIDGLLKDSIDLDKKIQALQDKMQQNSISRQEQAAELEKQRLVLEAMKQKRKS